MQKNTTNFSANSAPNEPKILEKNLLKISIIADSDKESELKKSASTNLANEVDSENKEIESNQFNTKQINEDNTRYGDWVVKGQAIDF